MPKLSRFYGIEISIRAREANHPRAHFHAAYGEFEASIAIGDSAILAGWLPARAMEMVLAWAALHRVELQAAWEALRAGRIPAKIEPLP
jgi:hypothetical protein